ncbi:MAG: GNAT family N-acetyltransferase [Peptostreptococcaceae bacterium]|nr:GNAT family N-acetyltransferase [Peptostreptococcaceae bacterium]
MIRKLREDEKDEILSLWLKNISLAHHFVDKSYWDEQLSHMQEDYLPHCEIVVATRDGKIVGFVMIEKDGSIIAVVVEEAYRRQGIGTELIRWAKNNYIHLAMSVYAKNRFASYFCSTNDFEYRYEQYDVNTGEIEQFFEWRKNQSNGKLQ